MMRHPKLVDQSLSTIDIPSFSSFNCLYKYAKALMNYVYIEDVNMRSYTQKEIAFMYLSHLDSSTHKQIADSLRNIIAITTAPLPMKYRVPGLATTITHQLKNTPLNGPSIQTSDGYCQECSDDEEDTDAIINYTNDKRRSQYSRTDGNTNARRQLYTKRNFSPKQTKTAYKGS